MNHILMHHAPCLGLHAIWCDVFRWKHFSDQHYHFLSKIILFVLKKLFFCQKNLIYSKIVVSATSLLHNQIYRATIFRIICHSQSHKRYSKCHRYVHTEKEILCRFWKSNPSTKSSDGLLIFAHKYLVCFEQNTCPQEFIWQHLTTFSWEASCNNHFICLVAASQKWLLTVISFNRWCNMF